MDTAKTFYVIMLKRRLRQMTLADLQKLFHLLSAGSAYETEDGAKIVRQVIIEKRAKELQTA
jgi:hypothetical protein